MKWQKKNSDKSFSTLVLIVQQLYKSYTQAWADSETDSGSDQIGLKSGHKESIHAERYSHAIHDWSNDDN